MAFHIQYLDLCSKIYREAPKMTSKHQRVPEITRLVDLYSRNCQKKGATGLKQSVKGVYQGATGLLQGGTGL